MNRLSDQDLERLLQLHAAPRPPAHLAARVKAEIPSLERFEIHPDAGSAVPLGALPDRFGTFWLQLLAAAAVLLTVAAALVLRMLALTADLGTRRVALGLDAGRAAVEVVRPAEPSPAEAAAFRLVAIEVAVFGPDDEPRVGARVALERLGADGRPVELLTDRRGRAQAAGLPPGTYRVRCTPTPGIAASDEVTLDAGQVASLLLLLETGR